MSTSIENSGRNEARARIWLVARREIVERTRQRAFIVSTLITVVLIAAGILAPKLLDRPSSWSIGVTDPKATKLAETAKQLFLASDPDATVTISTVSAEKGRAGVKGGELDVLVSAEPKAVPVAIVNRRLSDTKRAVLSTAIQQQRVLDESQRLGISSADAFALLAPGELTVDVLDPPDTRKDGDRALAFAAAILLFIQVMQFGMAVATGVVEEKSSRVLELLLGRMSTRQLLTGKLLGIGAIGLAQTLLFVGIGLILIRVSGVITPSGTSWVLGLLTIAWFLAGYLLFSGLYLIAGALAGRQEDLQSTTGIAMIFSMAGYLASIFVSGSPDASWAQIVSLIPFCAPMSQPLRFVDGASRWPEMLLAFGLTAITIWLLIRFAARIYNRTVLMKTQTSLWKTLRQRS
jgi:ABC-2 type transport system permease protein